MEILLQMVDQISRIEKLFKFQNYFLGPFSKKKIKPGGLAHFFGMQSGIERCGFNQCSFLHESTFACVQNGFLQKMKTQEEND